MKISAVISKRSIKSDDSFRERKNLKIFLVSAFALISGTTIYMLCENYLSSEIYESFNVFNTEFSLKTKTEIFTGLFISNLTFVIVTVILGSSSAGYLLILITGYIRIIGIGVVNTFLYSSFGLKGLEYSLLIFSPGKFLMLFSVILLMQTCIDNSLKIKSVLKGESRTESQRTYYILRIAIAVIIMLLSSLVDCVLAAGFTNLFSF